MLQKCNDVLKLIIIAVLCGIDRLSEIVEYGNNKKDFLKENFNILTIPSKSTLTRIMSSINSKWLSLSMVSIVKNIFKNTESKQIMIDRKAIKSTDAINNIEKLMNIVTAYTDTGISLGQITVEDKSNEIYALRELLQIVDIKGKVITADAMHC